MKHGTDHSAQLNRLKRIEGQVRGISKMVSEKNYCLDILGQIKAARNALRSLELKILEEHLHHCVKEDFSEEKIAEVLDLLKKSGH